MATLSLGRLPARRLQIKIQIHVALCFPHTGSHRGCWHCHRSISTLPSSRQTWDQEATARKTISGKKEEFLNFSKWKASISREQDSEGYYNRRGDSMERKGKGSEIPVWKEGTNITKIILATWDFYLESSLWPKGWGENVIFYPHYKELKN